MRGRVGEGGRAEAAHTSDGEGTDPQQHMGLHDDDPPCVDVHLCSALRPAVSGDATLRDGTAGIDSPPAHASQVTFAGARDDSRAGVLVKA
jgi:hypothetical protein